MTFHTARNGEATGVWQLPDLQDAVGSGRVLPTDLIWTDGFREWRQLHEVAKEIGIALPLSEETVPPIPVTEENVLHTPGIELRSSSIAHIPRRSNTPASQPRVRPTRGFPWLKLAIGLVCVAILLSLVVAIVVPAYRDYRSRADASEGSKADSIQSPSLGEVQQPASKESPLQISLENEKERVSYAIGMLMGAQLSSPELKDEMDIDFVEKGIRDVLGGGQLLFDEARAKEISDRFSEKMAKKVRAISSVTAQENQYEDSGSQECIAISRKYVAMKRRYDAGTLPAFDIAEMAQLQNFRGVSFGCEGGESREEKEYLAQHSRPNAEQSGASKTESTNQATTSEGTGNDGEIIELGAEQDHAERNRFDDEKRQLEEEKRQLQAQRDALEQDKLDAAQRREICENYRAVMEGQIRQGSATPANLKEGLRQRGCTNDAQSQSAGSTTPAAGGYVQIEFIGRDPPSPFTFRAASDDTNRVNGASAGIRFTGINLPCGMYRLMVDKPQDAGGGVARDTDLCKANGFMILPGEIYTLRNRSNSDLVSKNVRGQ